MDEIASELGVSKKTIYKYFPSKEKLLEEICDGTSCEVTGKVDEILEGNDDVVVKFVKLLIMHSNFTMNISDKWLKDLTIHAPHIKKNIDEMKNQNINKVLKKLVEQGKREKLIENYPTPIIIISFTSALLAATYPDFLIKNKFTLHNAFKITYEMLLNGILTEKGKKKFEKAKAVLGKQINL